MKDCVPFKSAMNLRRLLLVSCLWVTPCFESKNVFEFSQLLSKSHHVMSCFQSKPVFEVENVATH